MERCKSTNYCTSKIKSVIIFNIDIHPLALTELKDAYNWYNERSERLGNRFLQKVDKRINEIAQHPERYPKKKLQYRTTNIEVFPYILIYEIIEEEQTVFISYIFHAKRNPKLKYKR